MLQIDNSRFQNVHCINQTSEKISQGGAIKLQQINSIMLLQNNFYCTSSSYQDGALAIISQNTYQIVVDTCIFINCVASFSSGRAIYFELSQNITVNNSTFFNNTAQLERGGAIALQDSNLLNISNSNFEFNVAQIGGAIWYGPGEQAFKKYQLDFLTNKFNSNIGLFYGQNIGSCPTHIEKVTSQDQIIFSNQIFGLSSGSTQTEKVYFNFFDEENRVLNFTNSELYPQSLKIQNERMGYFMKVLNDQNPNFLILQGISLERVKETGSFQLLVSSSYKNSQQQSVSIQSNPLVNSDQLNYNLILIFRDCLRGELQISKNNFIEKLNKIKQIKDTSLPTLVDIIYGILYKGYKNKFFYWEIIKIYEKLLLMIIQYPKYQVRKTLLWTKQSKNQEKASLTFNTARKQQNLETLIQRELISFGKSSCKVLWKKKIHSRLVSTNFLTNNVFQIRSPNIFTEKQKSTEREYFLNSATFLCDQQLDDFDDNYLLSLDILQQKENQVIQIQDTYRESYSSQNQLKLNTIFKNL
ncbi:hypothetical protein ABPG72_022281 [Tetrahymena utriculariae]